LDGRAARGAHLPIDANDRLRRVYYPQAPLVGRRRRHFDEPGRWRSVRLGHAVAASSCVPGLFEPLVLEGLYPERVVRLVDGGVCDNQGVAGLLEQDCTVVLVSDGSGQSASERDPSRNPLGVLRRSGHILQARVRETQYRELYARRRSSLLRGLMFLHLKQELNVRPQDWVGCPDPYDPADDRADGARAGAETGYGIDRGLQERLASIRTDLDSFHDVEAHALMASGYRMAREHFPAALGFEERRRGRWDFEFVGERLREDQGRRGGERYSHLKRLFEVSASPVFKVWSLSPALRGAGLVLLAALAALLLYGLYRWPGYVLVNPVTLGGAGLWLAGVATQAAGRRLLGTEVMRLVRWRDTLKTVTRAVLMCVAGWLLALAHLWFFDSRYIAYGSLEKFKEEWGE
jgi:hypothetical protein